MKNIAVTVITGFIAGLVISGILFDVINYLGKSFVRVQTAWSVSKAEKAYSDGRFSESVNIYNKIIPKINPENKMLLAKTKNNLALSIIKEIETENNISVTDYNKENFFSMSSEAKEQINNALYLLNEAKDLYLEIDDRKAYSQTLKNITILETFKNGSV